MIKIKKPKPLGLKWKWMRYFRLYWIVISLVFLCFAVTIFVSDTSYQDTIRAQDKKIRQIEDKIAALTLLSFAIDSELKRAKRDLEVLQEGHTILPNKYGGIYQHSPIDKEKSK